ncbi:hypothetical protein AB0O07_06860 [Streptomyces sp. NPDC093085]|uniref:hypothetical protein n=1 Tax=Streptomyces sp. NPDC093085 TaxID=3155068 RepID=UPI0034205298
MEIFQDRTLLQVCDSESDAGAMRARTPGPTEQNGRGLQLVEALAERWFVQGTEDGKAVSLVFLSPVAVTAAA